MGPWDISLTQTSKVMGHNPDLNTNIKSNWTCHLLKHKHRRSRDMTLTKTVQCKVEKEKKKAVSLFYLHLSPPTFISNMWWGRLKNNNKKQTTKTLPEIHYATGECTLLIPWKQKQDCPAKTEILHSQGGLVSTILTTGFPHRKLFILFKNRNAYFLAVLFQPSNAARHCTST